MSSPETFYVTTPIYYVNDSPHLGHAYTTVAADAAARWQRARGRDVFFLTGTDEHGQKVYQAARERGLDPQEHVDRMAGPYRELWRRLDISNDDFIRTTERRHQRVVQAVLERLHSQGELYAADYEGWYSTAAERFWAEEELVDGCCPDTGQPVEWISERNWFFRMGRHADALRRWIEAHPGFLRPRSRRNEVLGYLRKQVGDLCITRPRARLPWGVELPWDPDYVVYVWFDALINYISAIGYGSDEERFRRWWPASFHLVGKDILTTHAVYWSTMLFALGLEPADCLFAHGWWTIEGRKMSKTLRNVVDPHLLADAYGPDAVRYFLLREVRFGADGDFSHQAFLTRYNAELANDLGNLAHRALSMTTRWLGGLVPPLGPLQDRDRELAALAAGAVRRFDREIGRLCFKQALEALVELVRAGNKAIDTEAPWQLNREGRRERLATVMRLVLELCRVSATLLSPVCPRKGPELLRRLGAGLQAADLDALGRLDRLAEGAPLELGQPLFPRMRELPGAIRAELDRARPPERAAATPAPRPTGAHASIEDFDRLDLRSGRIESARKHPRADRLLVLEIDLGEERPRTIVAGIADRYRPEDLEGRTVLVVANLQPIELRGVRSEGMLLAAGGVLATAAGEVEPGTRVR